MIRADVIVVGGGPAGAACAGRLQQGGAKVLVLDMQAFPRIKPCAGWVTPRVWQHLGLTPAEYPHGLMQFEALDITLWRLHFKLPTRQYAIRRVEFDDWLLKRSGAPVHQHHVRSITEDKDGFTVDGKFSAKTLVGAGGTSCPVQRSFFKHGNSDERGTLIAGLEEEFSSSGAGSDCRLWFFQNHLTGYAWFVPKANGMVNVGIGGVADNMKKHGERLKDHWLRLEEKLAREGLVRDHIYKPLAYTYHLRQNRLALRRDSIFLVGDSAGLATQDMGEGIGPAIESGLLAADAILNGGEYRVQSIPRYSLFPGVILRALLPRSRNDSS